MIRCLGLDQSLTATAAVWMRDGEIEYRMFRTKPKMGPQYARADWLGRQLEDLIRELRPTMVAVESPSHDSKYGSHILGGVRQVVLAAAAGEGVEWILEVAPQQRAILGTGKGTAKKAEVREAVRECWPECPNEHTADAALIMAAGCEFLVPVARHPFQPFPPERARVLERLSPQRPVVIA